MRPEIFRVPWIDLPVHGYGVLIVLGFLLATFLANREAHRRGLGDFVYDLGLVMLLSGVAGGRLFYYVLNYEEQFSHQSWTALFKIWEGGLVFYGGAVGGFLGGLAYLLKRKLPLGPCLDATAPFVPIGMAFGRLGCLFNGCCFGKVCGSQFALGITFPKENNPFKPGARSAAFETQLAQGLVVESDPAALPVHPIQLYEAAYDFLLTGVLWWYFRGPAPRNGGYPLLFVLYGVGRFCLEFFRGDHPRTSSGLTFYQNLSLGVVAFFLGLFIFFWRKDFRSPAAGTPENAEKTP